MAFGIPYTDELFTANLSLEDNFKLASHKTFFTGSFIYFITPRSGLYTNYYSINRQNNHTTLQELIFLDQTIPVGTEINAYFETQVFSFGYLLTIMRDSRVFFGAYLNIFFMDMETGVNNLDNSINEEVKLLLPLPNFGFIANFEISPWLYFDAAIGFFAIELNDISFSGSIYNVNTSLVFKPKEWLGLSLNYEIFDINIINRYDIDDTYIPYSINYHFSGPAVGISFIF